MNQELSLNTTLSHYRIVSKLGAGGMGEVYLAQDTRLDRKVALKILPAEVAANRDRMERFVREAKSAAALSHPNIITIHEIEQFDSVNFIAMEFIDGVTLREHMRKAAMKLGEVLDVAPQIAHALSAAHAANIVHRDIKPENIIVRRDGIVKVLDFGLAKLTERVPPEFVDSEAPTIAGVNTDPGVVMGTAIYMSPEQARGLQVDVRTDIFSLGVLIYEMVAGRLPFEGSNTNEIVASILSDKEPPPLARYSRETPAELERIVSKALRKNRDERYQTIKDMLLDLKSLKQRLEFEVELERSASLRQSAASEELRVPPSGGRSARAKTLPPEGGTLNTRPSSSAEYLISGIKQHKLGAALVLSVLLLAIGIGSWFFFHRPANVTTIDSIAVLPFVNESGNSDVEYLSDGMTESLINSLSELPHLSLKARSSVFRYKGKDVDPQKVASELSVQAILSGRVVQRGDDLTLYLSLVDARNGNQLWGEQYNRKLTDLVTLQGEIVRDVSEKLRLRLTSTERQRLTRQGTQNTQAYHAYLRGRFYWNKGFAPGYEKSRDYYQQAINLDATYAQAYSGLAHYYGFAATVGLLPPNENWPKAEAAANKALTLDDTLADNYNALAAVKLYYYRDWPAAERYFRRGIDLDPNSAEIRAHYALSLMSFGRNEEALAEIQRSVEIDPLSPRYNYHWGHILFFIRQYDRAIDQFRKTLELDANYVPVHGLLGDAYEQKGMQREAVAEWAKALTLSGESEQATMLENTYAASGFDSAVRALWQKKLEQLMLRTKRGDYVSAEAYATAYMRIGDKEEALAWLDKALQERNGFVFAVKVHPIYDKLRADPRYTDLMRDLGLQQ